MPSSVKQRTPLAASAPASAPKTAKRTRTVRPEKSAEPGVAGETRSVAELAYFHWLERGCPEGSPEDDWLRAERELQSR